MSYFVPDVAIHIFITEELRYTTEAKIRIKVFTLQLIASLLFAQYSHLIIQAVGGMGYEFISGVKVVALD